MRTIRLLCAVIVTLSLILLSADRNFAAGPKSRPNRFRWLWHLRPGNGCHPPPLCREDARLSWPADDLRVQARRSRRPGGARGHSPPDGYTILGSTQSAMVVIPVTQEGVPYTLESLPHLHLAESYPMLWVQSMPAGRTLRSWWRTPRRIPGRSISPARDHGDPAPPGGGLRQRGGVQTEPHPSPGGRFGDYGAAGRTRGHGREGIDTGLPRVKSGAPRPLGIFSTRRARALPNAPTISGQGSRVDSPMIYGLVGSQGHTQGGGRSPEFGCQEGQREPQAFSY